MPRAPAEGRREKGAVAFATRNKQKFCELLCVDINCVTTFCIVVLNAV